LDTGIWTRFPWAVSFPDDIATYRSRSRRNAKKELEWQHMMAVVRQEMKEIQEKLCAEFEVALTNHPPAIDQDATHGLISPERV